MAEFMRNGGFPMWVILATFVGTLVWAAWGAEEQRPRAFATGTLLVLAHGMAGMATGMWMVSRAAEMENPGRIVAIGMGELANNGVFAGVLATLLAVGYAWSSRPRAI